MRIVTKALSSFEPCLQDVCVGKKMVKAIVNQEGNVVAYSLNKIGSKSVYGTTYKFMLGNPESLGTSQNAARLRFSSLFTFAVKVVSFPMPTMDGFRSKLELGLQKLVDEESESLETMTRVVLERGFPNFPIGYAVKNDYGAYCFDKNKKGVLVHHLMMSELAESDLATFFKSKKPTLETVMNAAFQCSASIAAFHHFLKRTHNDAHAGNFLVHRVDPGGFWKYRIHGIDFYLPNLGFQLVIWDPMVSNAEESGLMGDYSRIFFSIFDLIGVESKSATNLIASLIKALSNKQGRAQDAWEDFVKGPFWSLKDPPSNRRELNALPYVIA